MPPVRRRLALLWALFSLAGVVALPAGAAYAQGAGDEQYQDPFGEGSGSGSAPPKLSDKPSGTTGSSGSGSKPSTSSSGSSPSASGSGGGNTAAAPAAPPAPSSSSSAPAPAAASAAELPETGVDARLLLLVGGAFVLCGLGLRLRTRPERF